MTYTFTQFATSDVERDFTCKLVQTQCAVRDSTGIQCPLVSVFHPFCKFHLKDKLGVEVRRSTIHGCGVFALRIFQRGDVIVPYTGEHTNCQVMLATQGRHRSPYAVQLANGQWVDASRIRGTAACVNGPTHGSGMSANVRMVQASFKLPRDARLFGCVDPTTDLQSLVGPRRTLRGKGWRRIPAELVKCMQGTTHMWLVASRPIYVGEELLLPYRSGDMKRFRHQTMPLLCDSPSPD
jgi:hypothetical protein